MILINRNRFYLSLLEYTPDELLDKLLENNIEPSLFFIYLNDDLSDEVIQLTKEGYSKNEIIPVIKSDFYDSKYENLNEFINNNKKLNARFSDFVQKSQYSDLYNKELDIKDIKFLKTVKIF